MTMYTLVAGVNDGCKIQKEEGARTTHANGANLIFPHAW